MKEQLRDILPTEHLVSPGLREMSERHAFSLASPSDFWGSVAEKMHWFEKKREVFTPIGEAPYGKWFEGWKTNLCYNAVDRWQDTPTRNRVAYYWEGEDGEARTISYSQLFREVNRAASLLMEQGIVDGDRITLYMPMIPELIYFMLAAQRIGAIHSVVFGGFAGAALAERIRDSSSRVLVTADGGYRRGHIVELKRIADEALSSCPSVEHVVVVRRTGQDIHMQKGRDMWYHDFASSETVPCLPVESNHPSYILYTSGTTGKPKGAVHSTGGYMVWSHYTTASVFRPDELDTYWCTADIGWVTGHTYVVYGPLLNGATSVIYEGAPDYPAPDRWWSIVERYSVSILYTAPTAIRAFMRQGERWPSSHNLSSLRLLGTVGEPINPEAWEWYFRHIGGSRCPVVDTWWQTETGGIMISALPRLHPIPLKPGSATFPLPGVDAAVVDEKGEEVPSGMKGYLIIRRPWPGQFITLWNDRERYVSTYFSRFSGSYYPADYAVRDRDGYFWLLGRADEVLKVAGHRIGTIEIEDALITHQAVAESAVVGRADEVRGETPVAFVVLKPGYSPGEEMRSELLSHIRHLMGPVALPSSIYFVDRLPKTRSGKIMRRLIRAVVEEKSPGDITTLEDETSVEEALRAYREMKQHMGKGK